MPRWPDQKSPPDKPVLVDLDVQFRGVNERIEPGSLPGQREPAMVTAAVNCRFSSNQVETRGGFITPTSFNPDLIEDDPDTEGLPPHNGFNVGAGTYIEPDGDEWKVVAFRNDNAAGGAPYNVWLYRDRGYPVQIAVSWPNAEAVPPLPPVPPAVEGVLAFGPQHLVQFSQTGPELIMWRPGGREPMHWNGDFHGSFEPASTAPIPPGTGAGLQPLPAAPFGVDADGRGVFPIPGTGEIGWTDLLEPRRWDAALSRFSIGGAGKITGLAFWRRQSLVVFKETSVWIVANFTGDLKATTLERITDQAGCISHRTITAVGGDLIWLGRQGIYRLTEVLEGSRQLTPVPVSWPIPRSMSRINWLAAVDMSSAALANGLWYLAVPADGVTEVPRTLFVLDTRTAEWQGEDRLDGWDRPFCHAMLTLSLYGRESVGLVGESEIFIGEHGRHDGRSAMGATDGIQTRVDFRGYALADAGLKRLRSVIVDTEELGTFGVMLSATADGQKAVQLLNAPLTRNRKKYLTYGRRDRDLDNALPAGTGSFAEPNREDYSLVASFTDLTQVWEAGGIPLNFLQAHRLKGVLAGVARWVMPSVSSSGGRLRITAVKAEGYANAE